MGQHKGYKHTEETKRKQKESSLKRWSNPNEPCNIIRRSKFSIMVTERNKRFTWNNGLTTETDERVAKNIENRRQTIIKTGKFKGEGNPFYGKKHSEETRNRLKENWDINKEKRIQILIHAFRNGILPTSYEKKISYLIDKYILPYRYTGNGTYWIHTSQGPKNPDFKHNDKKKVIEVYDEVYWHTSDYEQTRGKLFQEVGFETIFIPGKMLFGNNWEENCLNLLRN